MTLVWAFCSSPKSPMVWFLVVSPVSPHNMLLSLSAAPTQVSFRSLLLPCSFLPLALLMQFLLREMAFSPFFMWIMTLISHTLCWPLSWQRSLLQPSSWVTSSIVDPLSTNTTLSRHSHNHMFAWFLVNVCIPCKTELHEVQRPNLSGPSLCSPHLF